MASSGASSGVGARPSSRPFTSPRASARPQISHGGKGSGARGERSGVGRRPWINGAQDFRIWRPHRQNLHMPQSRGRLDLYYLTGVELVFCFGDGHSGPQSE